MCNWPNLGQVIAAAGEQPSTCCSPQTYSRRKTSCGLEQKIVERVCRLVRHLYTNEEISVDMIVGLWWMPVYGGSISCPGAHGSSFNGMYARVIGYILAAATKLRKPAA
jgi:hypothetical protein